MKQFFAGYAVAYDDHFTHSAIGRCQREQVWRYLTSLLADRPLRVLELNCGTGKDAIWLARQGHQVVATDISEAMVNQAREKVRLQQLEDKVEVVQVGIESLRVAQFTAPFDLIFSNFGGWNCLSPKQVQATTENLKACLTLHGKIVSVIMPDRCLWEQSYFLAKGNLKSAYRRNRGLTQFTDEQQNEFPLYYFSPQQFAQWWGNEWDQVTIRPVGLWVPPSYLNPHFEKRPRVLSWLQRRDLASRSAFGARYADHALITLARSTNT